MPLAAVAAIGAVGSIAGGAMSASAAGNAADAQAQAAMHAADLQHADAQASLAFQNKEWNTQQQNIAPWLTTGKEALGQQWSDLNSGVYGPWNQQFQAPTGANEQNDPGYQFRLQQGNEALEKSAAARGGLLSGGTGKALAQYSQDYASNEYNNVYNRALNQYQMGYNQFQQNLANRWNRYSALSGTGQVAANQLGQFGQQAAGNVANIYANEGQQVGQSLNNAGAARASGYIGSANAWNSAFGGLTNAAQSYSLMSLLQNQNPNMNLNGSTMAEVGH